MLNAQGDVVIENGDIQMVHGAELTAQTVKSVLGTQKGEWFLNADEGINHNEILGKKRYATHNSALEEKYIAELNAAKQAAADSQTDESRLNEMLARRLDGVD